MIKSAASAASRLENQSFGRTSSQQNVKFLDSAALSESRGASVLSGLPLATELCGLLSCHATEMMALLLTGLTLVQFFRH